MSPLTVDDFVAACAFVLLCIAGALVRDRFFSKTPGPTTRSASSATYTQATPSSAIAAGAYGGRW
jgi:hypothetical protein